MECKPLNYSLEGRGKERLAQQQGMFSKWMIVYIISADPAKQLSKNDFFLAGRYLGTLGKAVL